MILPGAMLGVLGGGQLGGMFVVAARTMGYRVTVLDPDVRSPAGALANQHLVAEYRDGDALERLGRACAAVTTEFENVPAESLRTLSRFCRVCPSPEAVTVAQDRIREKGFLHAHAFPTAPFLPVRDIEDLAAGGELLKGPALLKRAALGYDGRGQVRVNGLHEALNGFETLGRTPCVLEVRLDLQTEVSVVLARGTDGKVTCFPVAENVHRRGILDVSVVPARISEATATAVTEMATALAERLDYCGVLAVEFFITQAGEILVNEIAPRPHNSGHYTLDACVNSQFVQQVRVLCGSPPGDSRLLSPAVMVNLLGDLWARGEPPWDVLLRHPRLKLHLYGKQKARPGRKMGHFTCLDHDAEAALATAMRLRAELASLLAHGCERAAARLP